MQPDIIEHVKNILDKLPEDARVQLIASYEQDGKRKEPEVDPIVKKVHDLYIKLKPEQQKQFMSLCEHYHGSSE